MAPFTLFILLISSSLSHGFRDLVVNGNVQRTPEDGVLNLYEDPESRTLKCNVKSSEDLQQISDVQWFAVQDEEEEDLNVSSGSLDVLSFMEDDANDAVFRCRIGEQDYAEFQVIRKKPSKNTFRVKKFKKSYDVDFQMDEEFTCDILNLTFPLENTLSDLKIKWYKWKVTEDFSYRPNKESGENVKENCTEESFSGNWIEITGKEIEEGDLEPHIQVFESARVLKIEDARYSDRRGYKCVAFNISSPNKCSESSFFVRVKDKYAPLWPFLGIVVEVVVLLIIIFICEKRKEASKDINDDEDEYNGNAVGGSSQSTNSSQVRQRRT